MLLLLLLCRFSHVQLYATPYMASYQAPLSLGFSRQEHWSGLLLPFILDKISIYLLNLKIISTILSEIGCCSDLLFEWL